MTHERRVRDHLRYAILMYLLIAAGIAIFALAMALDVPNASVFTWAKMANQSRRVRCADHFFYSLTVSASSAKLIARIVCPPHTHCQS